MTDNGDGTAAVVLASSPASPVTSVGWKMYVEVNGSLYEGAGGTYENSLGEYTVSAFTNSTHFSLTLHPVPSSGTITVVICAADTYSSPLPVSFANAYTAYPNTVRMTSLGDIVLGEAWYNMMCRRIWLSGNPNTSSSNWNTITRLLPFGNNAFAAGPTGTTSSTSFGWLEIDITGACGPVDDIVMFKTDSNPGSAANCFRFSLDLSYNSGGSSSSGGDWFGDGGPDFPCEGIGGAGHYPWSFCFSRTQFRMLSIGLDPSGWFQWRPATPSDPNQYNVDAIGGTGGSSTELSAISLARYRLDGVGLSRHSALWLPAGDRCDDGFFGAALLRRQHRADNRRPAWALHDQRDARGIHPRRVLWQRAST